MTYRVEASQRRTDTRQWVMDRRERTRHLIELGGLVQKAGLVELTEDDRAVLLGAFLAVAAKLQGDERDRRSHSGGGGASGRLRGIKPVNVMARSDSENLDVERTLRAARLHRLIGKPAKPLPHADGRNTRHHDLGGVGRRDLRQGFALGHCLHPLNIHRRA